MKLHASGEDYLEAILVLHKKMGMRRMNFIIVRCTLVEGLQKWTLKE